MEIDETSYYKLVGEEGTYLFINKWKFNLNQKPNKQGNIVLYHRNKYIAEVTPEFFNKNFVKQVDFEVDEKSRISPKTSEEAIEIFRNDYKTLNRLILDCCEKYKNGTFTDRASHNYLRDIRKVCRYLDMIQPLIKSLKKKEGKAP